MPHGNCFLWKPEILWFHVGSDLVTALAYYSIPIVLFYFVKKRKDLTYKWVFILFGLFIFFCGTTHLFEIRTIWVPEYFTEGLIKAVTAIVSAATAIALWPLLPHALKLPSPAQLQKKNQELRNLNNELERRVEQRTRDSKHLAAIVNHSTDSIITTDLEKDKKITYWNPGATRLYGYTAEEAIGQSVALIVP